MGRIVLREFDGDLDALAAMAREAWLGEYRARTWPDYYCPDLSSLLLADAPDARFMLAAYDGPRLVAFLANFPRSYRLAGRTLRGVVPTMLAAGAGYGAAAPMLIAEALGRNRELGADVAVIALDRGHRSRRMLAAYPGISNRLHHIQAVMPLGHAIDLPRVVVSEALQPAETALIRLAGAHRPIRAAQSSATVRPAAVEEVPGLLSLCDAVNDSSRLVRSFEVKSFARRLCSPVAWTVVLERAAQVRAFVQCTARDMRSTRGVAPWAWVEYLAWGNCGRSERRALLAGLEQSARERGCIGILAWTGTYAAWPLLRGGFVPYPRPVDLFAVRLRDDLDLRRVRGVSDAVF